MKILFISNHFSLPEQPGAARPWRVTEYLSSLGHQVTVITNRRHYMDERIQVDESATKEDLKSKGISIVPVDTSKGRRRNLFRRLVNYFSFSIGAYLKADKMMKQDVVITGTPPLLIPVVGLLVSKRHKAYSILEVRDLYPETAVAVGKISNNFVIYFWERWENFWRTRYNHIVAVVPWISQKLIDKKIPEERITTITNGYDLYNEDSMVIPEEVQAFLNKYSQKFLFVYAGGMGYSNNLWTILEAAEYCQDDPSIQFVFFGEGDLKYEYQQHIRSRSLNNCIFFPLQSREVINVVFKESFALMQAFWNTEFHKCILANKIFEYHGAGRPIIFAGIGDTADLIQKAQSGIVVQPEDPKSFADAVQYLVAHPEEADKMGGSGKSYIEAHFAREQIFTKWETILNHSSPINSQINTMIYRK